MLDFLFEANLLFFLLGQVFDDIRHHRLELFVCLFTFLVIRLQAIVMREVIFVSFLKVLEIFGGTVLCPK